MKNDPLLQPFKLGSKLVKNRIFSTGHALSYAESGKPTETTFLYQQEKAKGGIGLSFVGGSGTVSLDTAPVFDQLIIDDSIIPFFQDLSNVYHKHEALLLTQITHLGRRTNSTAGHWLPIVAPSPIRETLHRGIPRAMDEDDIYRIVKSFSDAALRCKEGGLDGLEVMASGHLIEQFWSPETNRRTDSYGGSLINRMRFGRMVYTAMREAVGSDFLLGIRMTMTQEDNGKTGLSESENLTITQKLKEDGVVDFLNLVSGGIDTLPRLSANSMPGMASVLSPFIEQAGRFKKELNLPVFHATRVNDLATARHAIKENLIDLVGMTRAHIADPYIVQKINKNQEERIRTCVGATYCSNHRLCIQNPATAREKSLPHKVLSVPKKKKVVVVGGGPAGLEAARVCAERGHKVILFEASTQLGGQVILAGKVDWRKDILGIVDWLANECSFLGVEIHLNRYVEEVDIINQNPDIIVIATGGHPNIDWVEGNAKVLSTWDILSGHAKMEGSVFIHDQTGRNVSLAAADYISEKNVEVTLNTQDATVGMEAMRMEISPFMERFYKKGVKVQVDHELKSAERQGNQIKVSLRNTHTGKTITHITNNLVLEAGTLPNDEIFYSIKEKSLNRGVVDIEAMASGKPQPIFSGKGYHLYRVGDAVNSRDIHCAILDSLRICKDL